jgi:hypothetical protein
MKKFYYNCDFEDQWLRYNGLYEEMIPGCSHPENETRLCGLNNKRFDTRT